MRPCQALPYHYTLLFLYAAIAKAMKEACAEYLPREADGRYAPYNTWEAAEKMVVNAMRDAATSSDAHVDNKQMKDQIRKHIKNTNNCLRSGVYGKTAIDQKIDEAAKWFENYQACFDKGEVPKEWLQAGVQPPRRSPRKAKVSVMHHSRVWLDLKSPC
jgi:hypothetical protein